MIGCAPPDIERTAEGVSPGRSHPCRVRQFIELQRPFFTVRRVLYRDNYLYAGLGSAIDLPHRLQDRHEPAEDTEGRLGMNRLDFSAAEMCLLSASLLAIDVTGRAGDTYLSEGAMDRIRTGMQ